MDMSKTIIAKSDQLNADDLLGGPRTVEIERVTEGNADQPVAVFYKGCNGKPYYPCKSMRRVMVNVWGPDGHSYAGNAMTLFRDPNVKFGGIMVGGIRISHMSGLDKDTPLALQVTRGSKKLYTVKPLRVQQQKAQTPAIIGKIREQIAAASNIEEADAIWKKFSDYVQKCEGAGKPLSQDVVQECQSIISERSASLSPENQPADEYA